MFYSERVISLPSGGCGAEKVTVDVLSGKAFIGLALTKSHSELGLGKCLETSRGAAGTLL